NVLIAHRDPLFIAVDAGGTTRAGGNELGTYQRDVEHDAGDLCVHLTGECPRQHVFEWTDGNDCRDIGSANAGLQSRPTGEVKPSQSHDRAIDSRADWRARHRGRLSSVAREVRHRTARTVFAN